MIFDPGVFLIVAIAAGIASIPVLFGRENNWLHRTDREERDRKD